MVCQMFLRQRRIATGITWSTAGCQVGISAKPSSTTQSKRMPGIARAASVSAGKAWITSPRDEVLITSTRKLTNLDHRALQPLQGIADRLRQQLAQAIVVAETAGAVKTRTAIQAQAHHFDL